MIEIIGYAAAACTTISFFPQLYLVVKTRDTRSISLSMYLIFTLGILFWLMYGIYITSWPIILANAITFVSAAGILMFKLKNYKADLAAERKLVANKIHDGNER